MIPPPNHPMEDQRLRELRELGILDTLPEECFDRITRLASRLFVAPIALVSLVDVNRQWFKSKVGLDATETPRDVSFCGHAVAQNTMLVVEDAISDPRFADNPLVTGPPHIRFYAGAPLRSTDGLPLGTLCIIDRAARRFPLIEREALEDMARIAEGELRRGLMLVTVARSLARDRQLVTLIRALPEPAFACDSQGSIVAANPAASALFGRRMRDLAGSHIAVLFASPIGDVAELERDGLHQCVRADGTSFPARIRLQRVVLHDAELIVFSVHDESEWLERERRLARQADLLEMANDAIVVTDSSNVVSYWNRGAERMYGIAKDAAMGQEMSGLVSLPGGDAARQSRLEVVLGSKGYWEGDLEHRRSDGSPLTVFSRWSVRRDESDGSTSVLKINTDITERKHIEHMKDEFVSVVSHELRTPLSSVVGSLDLVLEFPEKDLGAEPRELVEMARRNAERLSRLVDDVLDVEKIASGKMGYRREPVQVRAAIDAAVECVRGVLSRRNIQVRVDEAPGLGEATVLADNHRLVQVLTNLLSNAAKFSPEHETVALRIERPAAGRIRMSVIDRGPGIPPSFADRIFQRFAQAADPLTRSKEGTGLGLAICKGLITGMGGTIGYESELGQGTTFQVELPEA